MPKRSEASPLDNARTAVLRAFAARHRGQIVLDESGYRSLREYGLFRREADALINAAVERGDATVGTDGACAVVKFRGAGL